MNIDKMNQVIDLLEELSQTEELPARAKTYFDKFKKSNRQFKADLKTRPILTQAITNMSDADVQPKSDIERLHDYRIVCEDKAAELEIDYSNFEYGVQYTCENPRVVDGDTIVAVIDGAPYRIRAVGYDTPEVVHPKKGIGHFGIQSSLRTAELVENAKAVTVMIDGEGYFQNWLNDGYGRLLAHIYIDGHLLGQQLIEEGMAEAVSFSLLIRILWPPIKKLSISRKLKILECGS
jgi:endonuclease YncB( thermonuclease family)